jgi:DNA-binding transcriptional regulator YdaS (Cro superfamily)
MKTSKLAIALAGLLAVSGTGVYAATNDTTTTEGTETTTQCERGERGERGMFGDRAAGQAALLEALGLTEAEVEAAREEGESLPELAEEKGITIEQFIEGMITSHEVKLEAAVESGDLTQEEADAILADHEERFADVTSYDDLGDMRGFGGGRHGGGQGPHHGGPFGGSNQDEDTPATDDNVDNQSTNSL